MFSCKGNLGMSVAARWGMVAHNAGCGKFNGVTLWLGNACLGPAVTKPPPAQARCHNVQTFSPGPMSQGKVGQRATAMPRHATTVNKYRHTHTLPFSCEVSSSHALSWGIFPGRKVTYMNECQIPKGGTMFVCPHTKPASTQACCGKQNKVKIHSMFLFLLNYH